MKNVMVDTGFWYALYYERDAYHDHAIEFMKNAVGLRFLIPFPTLYETINTAFAKNRNLPRFRDHITADGCVMVHDESYKELALTEAFDWSINRGRPLSLVDMIIRLMLDDVDLHVDGLLTFNPQDFADVCQRKNIEMAPY